MGRPLGFTGVPVTQRAIDALIAPLCIGKDATRIAPLMHELQTQLRVRRGGAVTLALSAVDIALWDIAGKAAGAPLHRLLGGGRDELTCYASLDAYADPAWSAPAVRKAADAGFPASSCTRRDLPVMRAAREEAGPDVALMIDVNTAWTVNQAAGDGGGTAGDRAEVAGGTRLAAGELRRPGPGTPHRGCRRSPRVRTW